MNDLDLLNGFSNEELLEKVPVFVKRDYKDPRFWKLSKDQEKGAAIIRLITDKNKMPFVRVYHYSSKKVINNKTHWLIADSPSSIELPCPIQEHYFKLLNEGDEETAKKYFQRKVKYITNIYVVKDPANPENNGKVFLYEFGSKLNEKFSGYMIPDETRTSLGEKPKDLYNPVNGYNIKLIINKNSAGFWSYDSTELADLTPTRVGNIDDDKELIKLLKEKTYDLSEFTSPEHFESYDEIKKKLDRFLNPYKADVSKEKNAIEAMDAIDNIVENSNNTPKQANDKPPFDTDDQNWLNEL